MVPSLDDARTTRLRARLALLDWAQTAALITEPQPQATIFIDPQNTGGSGIPNSNTANDNNDGSSIARALLTYNGGLARRWGGYAPRWQQNTTITFLSTQPDNRDPVNLYPFIEGSLNTVQGILGPGQQTGSGVLAGVVPRVRGGPGNLLQATLGAGLAVGQLIVNTTKGSRGWLKKSLGANVWAITQTFLTALPPPFNPAEDNTWANGDSYVVYQPIAINVGRVKPTISVGTPAGNYPVQLYQLTVKDPTGSLFESVWLEPGIAAVDCSFNRIVNVAGSFAIPSLLFYNCFLRDGLRGGAVMGRHSVVGPAVWGGLIGSQESSGLTLTHLIGATLQADVIIGANFAVEPNECGSCRLSPVYLDSNDTGHAALTASGPILFLQTGFEPNVIWGPGTFDTIGCARLSYPSGAGVAVAVFQNVGGLQLNHQTTACFDSITNGGPRTTGNPITPVNMDALMGAATGGSLYIPGGSGLSNDAGTF